MFYKVFFFFINLFPRLKKFSWKIWYNFISTRFKDDFFKFMNYGYYHTSFDLKLENSDEIERYPVQLYHHLCSKVNLENLKVLEVGSGRGGGASFISRYHKPSKMYGIDLSPKAVDLCNENYNIDNLNFLIGDSENIPFENSFFDVVINVESSHCYGSMKVFLNEVYRVLKPSGSFLFCDFRTKQEINKLYDYFNNSDFIFVNRFDITDNILKGLDNLSDYRKKNIEKSVPFLIRSIFETYAGIKDTDIYNSFKNGEMIYICAILKKQI